MNRRNFIKSSGSAAVVTGLAGCGGILGGGGSSETVTIGLQADLTGSFANIGFWHERITEAYVEQLQESDDFDHDIELAVADTATDSSQGVQAMRDLIQQDGADVVIGSQNSGVAIGSTSVAQETDTPYVSIAQAPSITGEDGNRWVLRHAEDVAQYAHVSVGYGVENLSERWTILYQDYAFGQQFNAALQELLPKAGAEVLDSISVQLGQTDLTSQLNSVPEETEVLFAAVVPPTSLSFLGQSAENDTPGQRFGPIQSVETVDVSEIGQPAEGARFVSPMPRRLEERDTEGHQQLLELGNVDEPDTPRLSHMVWSYEAVSLVADALDNTDWPSAGNEVFVEWIESGPSFGTGADYPQGSKFYRGADHQVFPPIYLEQVANGELRRRDTYSMEEPPYSPRVDFTDQSF